MELTFSRETVSFLFLVVLAAAGLLCCFWGYKYFRTAVFMTCSGGICFGGYRLAERLAGNLIVRLVLCIAVSFLGICLMYFVSIVATFLLEKIAVRRKIAGGTWFVSSLLGAGILAVASYYGIFYNLTVAGCVFLVCGTAGLMVQHRNREKQVQFKTYDDLLKLEPLKKEEKEC